MRTRYSRNELLVTLAGKVYIGIAVGKLVRCLGLGEVVQHGLLHRELLEQVNTFVMTVRSRQDTSPMSDVLTL